MREPHPDLFDPALNYKRAGTSSDAAAKAAKQARMGDIHRRIWAALREQPRTPDEIANDLQLVLNTARARMSDLRREGWIEPTGLTRLTGAGRSADVMQIVIKDKRP